MLCQTTIQELKENIQALKNQLDGYIKPELLPLNPTQAEIAKIDSFL